MLSLITLPDISTDIIAGADDFAGGMFSEMIPYALAIAGMIIGVLLVRLFVIKGLLKGTKKLTGRR